MALGLLLSGNKCVCCLLKTRSGLTSVQHVSHFNLPLMSSWDKVNRYESPEGNTSGAVET